MVTHARSVKRNTALGLDGVFYRFDGFLDEAMDFTPLPGWETKRMARRPAEGSSEYRLELLDMHEQVLTSTPVNVEFGATCNDGSTLRSTRVVAYVPAQMNGELLVFRRGDLVIHRREVSGSAPRLTLGKPEIKGSRVRLAWKASAARPLTFNVVASSGERRFVIERATERDSVQIDWRQLPGGDACRIGVLATDGVRSTAAMTRAFSVAGAKPALEIVVGDADCGLTAAQPFSLLAHVTVAGGARLGPAGLVWRIDGDIVARDEDHIVVGPLAAGRHQVRLTYEGRSVETTLEVGRAPAGYAEWRRAFESLDKR